MVPVMNPEASSKRKRRNFWIAGVVLLFLLAAAIPTYQKHFGPRQHVLEITGDVGGQIRWSLETAGQTEHGTTNLPAKLVFRARTLDFMAVRMGGYSGPMRLTVTVDGNSCGSVSSAGPTNGSVRFQQAWSDWSISRTP